MTYLEFIGLGCVTISAIRVADFLIHLAIGFALSVFKIDHIYMLAVDTLDYKPVEKVTRVSCSAKGER